MGQGSDDGGWVRDQMMEGRSDGGWVRDQMMEDGSGMTLWAITGRSHFKKTYTVAGHGFGLVNFNPFSSICSNNSLFSMPG